MELNHFLYRTFSVLLVFIYCPLQANKVFFNRTSQIQVTAATIPLSTGFGFKFRTCNGGAMLYQNGPERDFILFEVIPTKVEYTTKDSIFTPSTLHVQWNVSGVHGSAKLGKDLDKNIEYQVTFKPGSSAVNTSVELIGPSGTLSSQLPKKVLDFTHSGPLIAGNTGVPDSAVTGFVGCMESGNNIAALDPSSQSATNVQAGCPLENKVGCPKRNCRAGFTGYYCEVNIDDCASAKCHHYSTCVDLISNYTCQCGSQWTGIYCDNYLGPLCNGSLPCQNGGICEHTADKNNYTCNCQPGWTGRHCETKVSPCKINPCLNNGTCAPFDKDDFQCTCVSGFKGKRCEVNVDDCAEHPCLNNGHCIDGVNNFTCNCSGSGYQGDKCDVDIDECLTSPCQRNGTCQNFAGTYKCDCPAGYKSKNCETEIDECKDLPCKNGATCRDDINSYTCECASGFNGTNCDKNIDDCDPNPCPNTATCRDGVNNFTCECKLGYTGPNCSININDCRPDSCLNGGNCTDGANSFTCTCPSRFNGSRCEADAVDDCVGNQCMNNATCIDGFLHYNCSCLPGYYGLRCENETDECQTSPCLNNGTCIDKVNNFTCNCAPGYRGWRCEENIDDCAVDLCKNNGTCQDGVNSFTCHCTPEYHGPLCENKTDGCHPNPCKNNAKCNFVGNDTSMYNCSCLEGFGDRNCSTNIDDCAGSPCVDNATCVDGIGNHTCVCPQGFTGNFCEVEIRECASNPCRNNATCVDEIGSYRCVCPSGFNGSTCGVNIDDCPSHGCYNNGTCIDGINSYTCKCQPGFNGTNCENNINECLLHDVTCQHGGTCIDLINAFKCNCTEFTNGTYCELDINECVSIDKPCNEPHGVCRNKSYSGFTCFCSEGWDAATNCHGSLDDCLHKGDPPCKNGGTCIDQHTSFKCVCPPGWTNDDCSVDIDECALGYCENGATCFHSNHGFYNCTCAPGYTDYNCSTEINECDVNPCMNNANCTDLINDYNCTCPPGYTGKNCSIDINECESSPCLNNGTCIDLVAGFNCSCTANYTGVRCEYRTSLCLPVNPCLNNGTCVEKNHTYTCDCVPGFGGTQCENVTTIGLNGSSYMSFPISGGKDVFALAFEFRTTLGFGLLIYDPGNTLLVRLVGSELEMIYKGAIRLLAGAGAGLINGWYHRVELNVSNSLIHLIIDNSSCGANCSKQHVLQSGQTLGHVQSIYVGGSPNSGQGKNFIGCVQDVSVDKETVIPNKNGTVLVQASIGCPRVEVCKPNPCVHGRCVDKWNEYKCECTRPWVGPNCNTSLVSATFGAQAPLNNDGKRVRRSVQNMLNSSFAKFRTVTTFNASSEFSFLLRTRQANGLVAFLTDGSSKHVAVALVSGRVTLKVTDGARTHSSSFGNALNDGKSRLITIKGSTAQVNGTVHSITPVSSPIILAVTYLGGLENYSAYPSSAVITQTALRGCLQDTRLNNKFFQFYTIQDLSLDSYTLISKSANLGKGCPGEDTCGNNPCGEGGVCKDLWNEYRCDCRPRFGGKDCSLYGCAHINPCPLNATCFDVGVNKSKYECVLPATFNKSLSPTQYTIQDKSRSIQQSLSLDFRTREPHATLLYTSSSGLFVLLEVIEGRFNVRYNLWPSGGNVSSGVMVNDGKWHTVKVTSNSSHTEVTVSGLSVVESVTVLGGPWRDFVKNEPVIVGGGKAGMAPLKGCLRNVKVGGWLLPFVEYYNKSINIRHMAPLEPNFKGVLSEEILGCHGDNVCSPDPCVRGSCGDIWNDYQCYCPTGYAGKTCNQTANMTCAHQPCRNNAVCFNVTDVSMVTNRSRVVSDVGVDLFHCNCTPGYEGVQCERPTNECDPDPCRHGANCTDYHLNYTCTCVTGYTGRNCETDIDDCVTNNCTNGATCVDRLNGYDCSCLRGFNGTFCEYDIDECAVADDPCWDNGTISCNNTFGGFKCVCEPGFFGEYCQFDPSQACISNPCVNGGNCSANASGYHCTCPMGYSGQLCETDIRECSDRPCKNNGTCFDSHSNSSVKIFPGYRCNCTEDYKGSQCQQFIDPCDTGPCFYNRSCTRTSYKSYSCNCSEAYGGKDCEEKRYCHSNPCRNNGTCQDHVISCSSRPCNTNYTCECPTGYHGRDCELIIDYCAGVTCANGGTCVNRHREGRYECNCTAGYGNVNCTGLTANCLPSPKCEHNGLCIPLENGFRCECVPPYRGKMCDDKCFPDPCNKRGTCERTNDAQGFKCDCKDNYVGRTCNMTDPCKANSSPCMNGGECFVDKNNGNFTCVCEEGYTGRRCNDPVPPLPQTDKGLGTGLIVGIVVACILILLLLLLLIILARNRASNGTYSPSKQELDGARVEMNTMMKPPPEERLI